MVWQHTVRTATFGTIIPPSLGVIQRTAVQINGRLQNSKKICQSPWHSDLSEMSSHQNFTSLCNPSQYPALAMEIKNIPKINIIFYAYCINSTLVKLREEEFSKLSSTINKNRICS